MHINLYLLVIAYLFNLYKSYMDFFIFNICYLCLFVYVFCSFLARVFLLLLVFSKDIIWLNYLFRVVFYLLNFHFFFLYSPPPPLFFSFLLSFYITSYYVDIHDFYQSSSLLMCIVKF